MEQNKEREAFETWMRRDDPDYPLYRRDMAGSERFGQYCSPIIEDQWQAWLAARSAPTPVAEPVYDQSVVKRLATQMGWTPPSASPAALTDEQIVTWFRNIAADRNATIVRDDGLIVAFARALLAAQPAAPVQPDA
jgi:hypothetical protein